MSNGSTWPSRAPGRLQIQMRDRTRSWHRAIKSRCTSEQYSGKPFIKRLGAHQIVAAEDQRHSRRRRQAWYNNFAQTVENWVSLADTSIAAIWFVFLTQAIRQHGRWSSPRRWLDAGAVNALFHATGARARFVHSGERISRPAAGGGRVEAQAARPPSSPQAPMSADPP